MDKTTDTLATYIAGLTYEQLTPAAIGAIRNRLIDSKPARPTLLERSDSRQQLITSRRSDALQSSSMTRGLRIMLLTA